jgi:hypothetical protein
MQRKAHNLTRGDVFRLHVCGEVLTATPVADGRHIKVTLALENQEHRTNGGSPTQSVKPSELEFLDTGHVLEFICRPNRVFHLIEWNDDDDQDDDEVVSPPPLLTEPSD